MLRFSFLFNVLVPGLLPAAGRRCCFREMKQGGASGAPRYLPSTLPRDRCEQWLSLCAWGLGAGVWCELRGPGASLWASQASLVLSDHKATESWAASGSPPGWGAPAQEAQHLLLHCYQGPSRVGLLPEAQRGRQGGFCLSRRWWSVGPSAPFSQQGGSETGAL